MAVDALIVGPDGLRRCWWCGDDPLYREYHDQEWGRPVHDDRLLFEKLCLEGFQSGLAWITILRKRDRFREVFHGFEPETVAEMGPDDVDRLLSDPGIIRHRGKIEATVHNASVALEVIDTYGSLDAFLWDFAPDAPPTPPLVPGDIPAATDESAALARALKRRGWRFVGPTTAYAFMQAMGFVDDHIDGCAFRQDMEPSQRSASATDT